MKKIKGRKSFKCRITSVLICAVMVLSMLLPSITISAEDVGNATEEIVEPVAEEQGISRTADASTINDWIPFYGEETDTSNAGKIWTDKTVSAGDIQLELPGKEGETIQRSDPDNFLVGLSALSSSQSVTLEGVKPVDVMLVLDISNSMRSLTTGGESNIIKLVKAANKTIQDILNMNPKNRIGIVVFSGSQFIWEPSSKDTAFCLLPLDRYTTENHEYILLKEKDSSSYISISPNVLNFKGENMNAEEYKVTGLTYIQNGLLQALEVFQQTTIEEGNTEGRIPVITLMTDGAPTSATINYTERVNADVSLQDGAGTDIRRTFLTQLTAAWVKQNVEELYQLSPLFYTVGIVPSESEASYIRMVLDPRNNNSVDVNGWWNQFMKAKENEEVHFETSETSLVVKKKDDRLQIDEDKYYVDQDGYFEVNEVQGIIECFEKLVERIELETAVFPIEETPYGSLDFDDRIGSYMNVTQMTGILYEGKLHKGHIFAQKMNKNNTLSEEEKNAVLNAISERITITANQAEQLFVHARNSGQISYTSDTDFSNYISWYADGTGNYLAPVGNEEIPIEGAEYINQSYFYYDDILGNSMLRIDVRLEENIKTKEQTVKFSIPADLLPLVKYSVIRDASDPEDSITEKTTASPIQLFYEVNLRDSINMYDISGVDTEYPHLQNSDIMKNVSFYTNKWQMQDGMAETLTTVNFDISDQNSYYYYTKDTPVYIKNSADELELYTGEKPIVNDGKEYYYQKTIYGLSGGLDEVPALIDNTALQNITASNDSDIGTWVIPQGTFRYDTMQTKEKEPSGNITNTADYVRKQMLQTENGCVTEFLGNNGKISIQQGKLKVLKEVENNEFITGDDENTEFQFEIDLKTASEVVLPQVIIGEKQGEKTRCLVENGKIKFGLLSGESIEFWLPVGEDVSLEEVGENIKQYKTYVTVTQYGLTTEEKETRKIESLLIEGLNKTEVDVKNSVQTYLIDIYKSDKDMNRLGGATFELYRLKCKDPKNHTDKIHNQIITRDEPQCWEYISTAISDESDGYLSFKIDGISYRFIKGVSYRFIEITAPDGYITPVGQWNMTVNSSYPEIQEILGPDGEKPPASYVGDTLILFMNVSPIDPPITGGRGIWQYFLLGAVITFGGVGLIVYQIRRKKHGNS